jgi:hypothetical protein
MTDLDGWVDDVQGHCGAVIGIALSHPGHGLLNALNGDYHADSGDTHGGLKDWCDDHPGTAAKDQRDGAE